MREPARGPALANGFSARAGSRSVAPSASSAAESKSKSPAKVRRAPSRRIDGVARYRQIVGIGREILRAQKAEGWGAKVVERLAKDLAAEFPEMGGFSRANMLRMRSFYAAWCPIEILPQAVAKSVASIVAQPVGQLRKGVAKPIEAPIVAQAVRQLDDPPEPLTKLSWSANIILLERLKDPAARLWYARKTLEHGWSRAVLTVQIESRLQERTGKAITNFDRTLPPAESDLAREVLKDPYTFDFL